MCDFDVRSRRPEEALNNLAGVRMSLLTSVAAEGEE